MQIYFAVFLFVFLLQIKRCDKISRMALMTSMSNALHYILSCLESVS